MFTRSVVVVALATACQFAVAQTESTASVPAPLAVQRLAPQLVTFAGSDANFQNLVSGLAAGTQVQLVTTLTNGLTQTVTFTPAATSSPTTIAQILETARQQLIGQGIGTPTAEQIAFTLMGGVVPNPFGGTQVSGLVNPAAPAANTSTSAASPARQMQQQSAGAGATAPVTTPSATPATTSVNVQTTPTPVTSTTVLPRQTSDSTTAPGATSRSTATSSATPVPATTVNPVPTTSASPAANTSASPGFNTTPRPNTAAPTHAPATGSAPPAGGHLAR
jgi:hypothetical protein